MNRSQALSLKLTNGLSYILILFSLFAALQHHYYRAILGMVIGLLGCWVTDVMLHGYKGSLITSATIGLVGLFFMFLFAVFSPILGVIGFIVFVVTAVITSWSDITTPG